MIEDNLEHFVCPSCHRSLSIKSVENKERDRIKEGSLICGTAQHRFQVRGFIPRFVSTHDVTSSFGFEWNKHPRWLMKNQSWTGRLGRRAVRMRAKGPLSRRSL